MLQLQPNSTPRCWLPKRYLAGWAVPDGASAGFDGRHPLVWRVECATRQARLLPIEDVCLDAVEHEPAFDQMLQRLEDLFAPTMREVIVPRRALGPEDRAFLAFFAAAMLTQIGEQRDDWQGEWQQILEQMQRKDRITRTLYSPALVQGWATVMSGDSHDPLPPTVRGVGRILSGMSMAVFTADRPEFITSDTPCVVYDPDARAGSSIQPLRQLTSPSTQVQLPLAPTRVLNFSWQRQLDGRYVAATDTVVDEVNRTTQSNARKWLICSGDKGCDSWPA